MQNNTKTVFQLLAKGRLSELEKLCINNPKLRSVLLHWRGVRQTAFFKKRLKFYKNFAKQTGLRKFTPEVKNQMRNEFAKRHCLTQTLKTAYQSLKAQKASQNTVYDFLNRRKNGRLGLF